MNHDDNITPAALLEQLVYVDTFMPEIDDPSQLDERLTAELSAFADDSFVFPDEEKPSNSNNNGDLKDEHIHANEALVERFNQINNSFAKPRDNEGTSSSSTAATGAKTFSTLQQSTFNTGISNILSPLSSLSSGNNHHNQGSNNSNNLHQHHINNQSPTSLDSNDLLSTLPKVPVPPGAQSSLIAAGLSQTQIDALAALIAQHQGSENNDENNNNIHNGNDGDDHRHNGHQDNHFNLHESSSSSLPHFNSITNQIKNEGIFNGVNPSVTTTSEYNSTATTPTNSHNNHGSTSSSSSTNYNHSTSRRSSIKIEPSGDVDLDKRRRNTAASARFRIKKKLKEQQLERSVRELNELTITLEKKIQTLEMENKLLRNLVVEKGEQRNNDELEQLRKRARLANGIYDDFDQNGNESNNSPLNNNNNDNGIINGSNSIKTEKGQINLNEYDSSHGTPF